MLTPAIKYNKHHFENCVIEVGGKGIHLNQIEKTILAINLPAIKFK